ncbi:MAG: hypothetical protein EBU93_02040 [Chlamydiae bacterium]|nr:hypothetical protein [Chlamydiota bacterium]
MSTLEQLEAMGLNLLEKQVKDKNFSIEKVGQLYEMGYHHFKSGDYQKAKSIFVLVTSLSPFYADAVLSLGLCHFRLKDYLSAKRAFEVFCVLKSSQPEGYLYLGYCHLEINEADEAYEKLQKALSLMNPSHKDYEKTQLICERISL